MPLQPITTALSRALALRLEPSSTFLGGGLQLTISPRAQASNRVVQPASQPMGSQATALGLGLGSSRFLADAGHAEFFNSPALSVLTGGGSIAGAADATATTIGRNDNSAEATAVNIGLANLDVLTRGGGVLQIGTSSSPLTASASAATRSLLAPRSSPLLTAQLTALATVRGLEGVRTADPATTDLPSFYGQPKAAVLARAVLDADPGPAATSARAGADARGIEGYRVMALAPGGGAAAQVSGLATAILSLIGAPPTSSLPADLTATAIGIDHVTLRGPGSGAVVVQGSGLALLEASNAPPSDSLKLNSLQGIGILAGDIQSNGGAPLTNEGATVRGWGGFAAPPAVGLLGSMDAAGIDRSTVLTGSGNDTVEGRILTEQETGVDANGDGRRSPTTFLDASALQGGQGGFDGIRNSLIHTGAGDDSVRGSASASVIDTGSGNDLIQLDRARDSSMDGGFGNDTVRVTDLALDNGFRGGFGNDTVEVAAGSGNRLDGGFGQDLLNGGAATKTIFQQSNAGAALDAAALISTTPATTVLPGASFAERLTDPDFWNSEKGGLSAEEMQTLWTEGTLQQGAQAFGVDTMSDFSAARGDILELSSSLGSLTQGLWEGQGALFGVQGGQLVVREGPVNSQLGVVVGTLADIHSLGIGSPSLAYATDTRQLMFDADGDWKDGGSRSLGTVNMADPAALTKANIQFGTGA
ncbi:hypothetical protein NZK32_06895 [Cyanobium sp. FGCU-52]|nr:hypothetical protein [Cyanobium sp. FGCU52]